MPGVCLSVCLFVCLPATSYINYWSDLHENFTTEMYLWIKKSSSNFGSHSHPDEIRSARHCMSEGLNKCCCAFCPADHATAHPAAHQMYTRSSVMCNTTSKYRVISPIPPVIFLQEGAQKVRFWALSALSLNEY